MIMCTRGGGGKRRSRSKVKPGESFDPTSPPPPDPPPPTEGELLANEAYTKILEHADTLDRTSLHIYETIQDVVNSAIESVNRAETQIKVYLLTQISKPVGAILKSQDLVRDKIRYTLGIVNEHLARTPVGVVHSAKEKDDQVKYYQAFITGTLPMHGLPDPPGDTVESTFAKLGWSGSESDSDQQDIKQANFYPPGDPVPSPTPTPTPDPTPTPTPGGNTGPPEPAFYDCPGPTRVFLSDGTKVPAPKWDSVRWMDKFGVWGPAGTIWYVPGDWTYKGDIIGYYPSDKRDCTGRELPPGPPKPTPSPTPTPTPTPPPGDGSTPPGSPPPGGTTPPPTGVGGGGGGSGGTGGGGGDTEPGDPGVGPPKPPIKIGGPITTQPEPTPAPTPPIPISPKPLPPIPINPIPSPIPIPIPPIPTPNPIGPGGNPPAPPGSGSPPIKQPGPPTGEKPEPPIDTSPGYPIGPGPEPEPAPPVSGVPTKRCTGDVREDPCFREIGGKQGSEREIYVGPGWTGRIKDAKGDTPNISIFDNNNQGSGAAFGVNLDGPGVCDPGWQYSLISNDVLVKNISGNIKDATDKMWSDLKDQSTGKSTFTATLLTPISYGIGVVSSYVLMLINTFTSLFISGNEAMDGVMKSEVALGWAQRFLAGGLRKHGDVIAIRNNFNVPIRPPTRSDAVGAYLANTIDECKLEAYVRADDFQYDKFKPIVMAARQKFTTNELAVLSMRDGFKRGDLDSRLREVGVLDGEYKDELMTLAKFIPGPGDLIRFMVRDVADTNLVHKFGMDDSFGDKWQGQLERWGKNQGISTDVAKYFWRAHWTIPSPTQLYEIFHRLRDRPGGMTTAQLKSEIKVALEQQDILPYWIDRLVDIAYSPMTRTDAKRAFDQGTIDEDSLKRVFIENGYNDDDADRLVEFAKVDRRLHIKTLEPIKLYADGILSLESCVSQCRDLGYKGSSVDLVRDVARSEYTLHRANRVGERIVSGIRSHHYSIEDVKSIMGSLNVDGLDLNSRIQDEFTLANYNNKHIPITRLCSLLGDGVITPDEYVSKGKESGWSSVDLKIQLTQCTNKALAAKAKKALQDEERESRKAEKAQKDAERAADKANREAQALAKQVEVIEGRRQRRNQTLENAAAIYAAKIDGGPEVATQEVITTYNSLITQGGLSQDEAVRLLTAVATNWGKYGDRTFEQVSMTLAPVALDSRWALLDQ